MYIFAKTSAIVQVYKPLINYTMGKRLLLYVVALSGLNAIGAPSGEWKNIGKAVYYEDLMTSNVDVKPGHSWVVNVEDSQELPGWYRFQPYNDSGCYVASIMTYTDDAYLYINATDPEKVYMEDFEAYDDYLFSSLVPENDWEGTGDFYGKLVNDVITFAPLSIGLYDGDYDLWYPASKTTGFKLELGKDVANDYGLSVKVSTCASDGYIFYKPDAGGDVWTVKGAVYAGEFKPEYYDVTAESGEEVEPGMTTQYQAPGRGRYTIVVVGFDRAGNQVSRDYTYGYTYDRHAEEEWVSVGKAAYTEDFAASKYLDIESVAYEVELEELAGSKGYYRMVDPYREHPVLRLDYPDHAMHDHYVYINAMDLSAIYLEDCPVGLELGGGDVSVASVAAVMLASGKTKEDVKAEGDYFGHLSESGELTFAEGALLIGEKNRNKGDWMKAAAKFKLQMPAGLSHLESVNDNDMKDVTEIFTLDGVKVAKPTASGVYIVKSGGGVRKIAVK